MEILLAENQMKNWDHLISSYVTFVVSGLSSYDYNLNKTNCKTGMLLPIRFWKDRVLTCTNLLMRSCNPVAAFPATYSLDVSPCLVF